LNAFLKREDPFEEAVERRIIEIWVTQLKDKNMEVKSNSVRCIKATSDRMREQNIMKVTDSLAGEIATGNAKDALDIYSLTLQNLVNAVKEQYGASMIRTLNNHLLKGLKTDSDEIRQQCLDIFSDVFRRFGGVIVRQETLINKNELMKPIS
jgi:hypothetical protein